eukprot:355489-Chlamydomonas_euryale.AAC.17
MSVCGGLDERLAIQAVCSWGVMWPLKQHRDEVCIPKGGCLDQSHTTQGIRMRRAFRCEQQPYDIAVPVLSCQHQRKAVAAVCPRRVRVALEQRTHDVRMPI